MAVFKKRRIYYKKRRKSKKDTKEKKESILKIRCRLRWEEKDRVTLPRLPLLWSPRGIPKPRLSFPCSREWLGCGVMQTGELAGSSWSLIYSWNVEPAAFYSTTVLTKYATHILP
jgi:hypothetical protein